MNPVEPLAAPQRQHLRYLLEQGLPLASRPYRVLAERICAGADSYTHLRPNEKRANRVLCLLLDNTTTYRHEQYHVIAHTLRTFSR
ncbi:hypothetical protein ACLI36_35450, partial [Pseudomonas aeruginosa]